MKRILIITFLFGAYSCRAGVNAPEVLKTAIRQVLMRQSAITNEMGRNQLYHIDTIHTPYIMRWLDTLVHYDDDIVYTFRPSDPARGDSIKCYTQLYTGRDPGFVYKIDLFFPVSEWGRFKRELEENYLLEKGQTALWYEKPRTPPSATYHRRTVRLTKEKNVLRITCTMYTIII